MARAVGTVMNGNRNSVRRPANESELAKALQAFIRKGQDLLVLLETLPGEHEP